MSYLAPPRLQFAGRFQAAPSTVNNDPTHYDNATFDPSFKLPGPGATNGWWNPRGDAAWRLIDCTVGSASRADGSAADAGDPVLGGRVADSDRRVCAKLVDLDPEQQMVSEIWGLEVRICAHDGTTLVRGEFEPAPFSDIWNRAQRGGGGDIGASAAYHSVLSSVEWGDVAGSAVLSELKEASAPGLLSIKFTVDGYNMSAASPRFTLGRIAGAIGPAAADEPRHFVRGRQFMAASAVPPGGFFAPAGRINFFPGMLDERLGKVHLDLANALPTDTPGGPPSDLGWLALSCDVVDAGGNPVPRVIDTIDYLDAGWYERTAGIVSLPSDRALTSDEVAAIRENPLSLRTAGTAAISEPPLGLHVRADQFVFRLDPGEPATVHLYATRYGAPAPGARIVNFLDPLQLQVQGGPDPGSAIDFPERVVADERGVATVEIATGDPGNPRGYLDGLVFGIRPAIEDTLAVGLDYPFNKWDFVSLLVWDRFAPDDPPTWHGSLAEVFTQYGNLYPVMDRLLDLSDYESVCASRDLLVLAYALPTADPNSMPVTRDLSAAKRAAILRWLREPGPDGKPLLGTPPAGRAAPEAAPARAVAAGPGPGEPAPEPAQGGKAAAAGRALVHRIGRPR
jgi:hypothetical protein